VQHGRYGTASKCENVHTKLGTPLKMAGKQNFSISIVKPTRCTNVSNLFYFGMTLYMFRALFSSIISSSRLYIQLSDTADCLLASSQQYLFDSCMDSLELLMMDEKSARNM